MNISTWNSYEYPPDIYIIYISQMNISPRAILELEMERLSLRQKIFELTFTLEDQELFFNAQVRRFFWSNYLSAFSLYICVHYSNCHEILITLEKISQWCESGIESRNFDPFREDLSMMWKLNWVTKFWSL